MRYLSYLILTLSISMPAIASEPMEVDLSTFGCAKASSPFHNEQEQADLEACLQSEWYPKLRELYTDKPPLTKLDSPFELVKQAVTSLATGQDFTEETKETLFALCDAAYKQVQSASLKSYFTQALYQASRKDQTQYLRLLKMIIADKTMRSYKSEELFKEIREVMYDLFSSMLHLANYEEKEEAQTAFFDYFEVLNDLDPTQDVSFLKEAYPSEDYPSRDMWDLDFRFNILLALKGRDEKFYQTKSRKILSQDLDNLADLLIESTEKEKKAEGSLLSLDAVFKQMCHVLSQPQHEEESGEANRAERAFKAFALLFKTSNNLSKSYAEQLAPQLKTFLANKESLIFCYDDLVHQGPILLRDAAFQAMIAYIVNVKPEKRFDFRFINASDSLFNKDNRRFGYISDKRSRFFRKVFEDLSAVRADYPIQQMWQAMDLRTRKKVRQEMVKQIRAYFKLPTQDMDSRDTTEKGSKRPTLNFQEIIRQSLIECVNSKSLPLPTLHEFCETAKKTGLYKYLPEESLLSIEDQIFWSQDFSLTQRCEAFNNILRRSVVNGTLETLRNQCLESLKESPLLCYTLLAVNMMESTPKTTYAMYELMSKMIDLKKFYPEICIPNNFILDQGIREMVLGKGRISESTCSPRCFTNLFNMKLYHRIGRHDENAPYVALENDLKSVSLDEEGHVYGLLYENSISGYKLYKFDPYTGYAKWSMTLLRDKATSTMYEPIPIYTIGSNKVYVILGEDQIVEFDRTTGEYLQTTTIHDKENPDLKLSFIGAVGKDLFAASIWEEGGWTTPPKAVLNFLPQGEMEGGWSLKLPKAVGRMYHFDINGAYFVCTDSLSRVKYFFNSSGKSIAIYGDPSADNAPFPKKYAPKATVDGDMLYYIQKQADKSYQLVYLNLITGKEIWRTTLPGEPQQEPVLSVSRDCVFMLFTKSLCALSVGTDAPASLLWQISTDRKGSIINKFDHIAVSADGQYVYGLNNIPENIYRYDVKTGAEEDLGKFGPSPRSARLIGSRSDGKVLIKTQIEYESYGPDVTNRRVFF